MSKSKLWSMAETLALRLRISLRKFWPLIKFYRRFILFVVFPVVFSPLLALANSENIRALECGLIVMIMSAFWSCDVLPMPVTALIPVVCYPLFQIAESMAICQQYMTSNNMLFLGGLLIALAIEETRLHERIALRTLMIFGTQPRWLMAGLMSVAAILSMWISNTATTAMLLPIAQGVCLELAQKVPLAHRIRSVSSIRRRRLPTISQHDCIIDIPSSPRRSPLSSTKKKSISFTTTKNSISLTPLLGDKVFTPNPVRVCCDDSAALLCKKPNNYQQRRKLSLSDTNLSPTPPPIFPSTSVRRPLHVQRSVGNFITTSANSEELEVPANLTRLGAVLHTYPPALKKLFGGIMLCIAYASNIGGIATLIGTPTNLIFKGLLDQQYGANVLGVNFASFMLFGVPCAFFSLVVCWLYMQWVYCCGGFGALRRRFGGHPKLARQSYKRELYNVNDIHISKSALQERYAQLGPLSWAEGSTTMFFTILFVAWILRSPGFMSGWCEWFGLEKFVSDAQPAILIAILLFIWPFNRPTWPRASDMKKHRQYRALLNWRMVESSFPWGVVLLLGGGVAMASGVKSSGLGEILSGHLANVSLALPPWLVVVIIGFTLSLVTEFVSNTAATTVSVPILFQLAQSARQNPVYYSLPAAIASSFAFMLPVATPPNAIVFNCGWLKITDMIKVGCIINLLCTAVLIVCMHTVAVLAFNVLEEPASIFANATTALNNTLG